MKMIDAKNKTAILYPFILLVTLLALTFVFLIEQIQPVGAYQHHLDGGKPLYIPFIMKNYHRPNPFGVSLDSIKNENGLNVLALAQMSWTRRDVVWEAIEPTPGARHWDAAYEQELVNASQAGIQPILIFGGTPKWALKPGFKCGAAAEDQLPALGQFVYDLVKRYSAAPFNIQYWEIYNEPDAANMLGCWGDPSDPDYYGGFYYGQMLKTVYPQIKAADPQAQVLVGGLLLDCDPIHPPAGRSCVESRFLRGILENGAGPFFDGVAFHGYDYMRAKGSYWNPNWHSASDTTGPVSIIKAHYLKALLAEYGQRQKYLLNTETAVFSEPYPQDVSIVCSHPAPEIETTKAYYVIQSYAVAVAEGWRANIWYSAFGQRCSGLLKMDLTPQPAYYAFQLTVAKLKNSRFIREITDHPELKGYEFEIPGRRLWLLWSLTGNTYILPLNETPLLVTRVGDDGKPVVEPGGADTIIDLSPRFIEFQN